MALWRKLGFIGEFCQVSFQHCFQFMQSDPIEQSAQMEFHQEQPQKIQKIDTSTRPISIAKMREEDIQNRIDDHDPFSDFQQTYKPNVIQKDVEKVPLRYDEDDVQLDGKGWHDDDDIVL